MTTKQINEAAALAPVFNGDDKEIASLTQSWASIMSTLSYFAQPYEGTVSDENKKALYIALKCYMESKLQECDNVTPPPYVATAPLPVPAVAVPPVADEVQVTYESKKESIGLQRLRELAGIPHPENRV